MKYWPSLIVSVDSKTGTSTESRAATLKQQYQDFLHKAEVLFPKVDQKLLLTILQFQTEYADWEGGVLLKVVYPPGHDMNQKKEAFYQRYGWMSSVEEHKMLRMKAIRIYVEEIEKVLDFDPDIR